MEETANREVGLLIRGLIKSLIKLFENLPWKLMVLRQVELSVTYWVHKNLT